ncbi:MAG TPA: hypothetical protein VMW20_01450 [Candidatus Nanoarchaeia archaeon]|nr:hypothetical protein [Candidatus Nanoarchaeia archaeon]
MPWHSIDVVDNAFDKTKKALIEPFSFWKWIKLGIIIFLMGGIGGFNFNPSGFNNRNYGNEGIMPSAGDISAQISQFLQQYLMVILIIAGLVLLLILIFSYISNIMEFVFVHSLVTNKVRFWEYSRKYLRLGFNLFIIRILLMLAFFVLLGISMLPLLLPILDSPENIGIGFIFSIIIWVIFIFLVLAIIFGIIGSFINLSIPLAMYHNLGIIAAFKKITARFRADWKQILVYWVVRSVLGIAVTIIIGIVALIFFIIVFGISALVGVLLYFVLGAIGLGWSDPLFWVVFIPYFLIAYIVLMLSTLFIIVPGPVFLKYHMLTFLQVWYTEATIPFFNAQNSIPGELIN